MRLDRFYFDKFLHTTKVPLHLKTTPENSQAKVRWRTLYSPKTLAFIFLLLTTLEVYKILTQISSHNYNWFWSSTSDSITVQQNHTGEEFERNGSSKLFRRSRSKSSSQRIVLWTKYFDTNEFGSIGILGKSTFENCSVTCEFVYAKGTSRPKFLRPNDAVVFHARDLSNTTKTLPFKHRHPDQVWIFLLQESPEHSPNSLMKYLSVFNWTMTFRHDSDVFHPYGIVKPINKSTEKASVNMGALSARNANKTRLAAVIITHCNTPSNRESLLNDLQDSIPIYIHGTCGNYTCPGDKVTRCKDLSCKYEQFRRCCQRLSQSYKFYFSFENSLCLDYVSEKFFNVLLTDMIPVVYGGANYSAVAPPHSYINARDFQTPKHLADYLLHLDTDRDEYMKYFEWKKKYYVDVSQRDGWCDLCTKLRSDIRRQNYESIQTWWEYPIRNIPNEEDQEVMIKSPRACEPKPRHQHAGWRDKRKNKRWR